MQTRNRVVVSGRVQGVGFRASCSRVAARLGVAGSVRNRTDGTVEVVVEGEPEAVAELLEWCRSGPTFASVTAVDVVDEHPEGLSGFRIE